MAEGHQLEGHHIPAVRHPIFRRHVEYAADTCTARSQPSGTQNQAAALQAEGVTVATGTLGELSVDFEEYGWFPRVLPSEEGEESPDESDED